MGAQVGLRQAVGREEGKGCEGCDQQRKASNKSKKHLSCSLSSLIKGGYIGDIRGFIEDYYRGTLH